MSVACSVVAWLSGIYLGSVMYVPGLGARSPDGAPAPERRAHTQWQTLPRSVKQCALAHSSETTLARMHQSW